VRAVTDAEAAAVDSVVGFIDRFGMHVPAILALESMRPLTFVGSQFMHLLTPSLGAFLTVTQWEAMASLLEERDGVEYVIQRIEAVA
jgi:extradiol dioxygenase family protein